MSVATLRYTPTAQHMLLKRRFMCSNLSMNTLEFVPLFGPPEIYKTVPCVDGNLDTEEKHATAFGNTRKVEQQTINDPFMNLMVSKYNTTNVYPTPPLPFMGFTENGSPTFSSSGNHCLDFFFHVVPDTPRDSVTRRIELAWEQNPLTALKLVFNLRGVRGTGKGDREGFYSAALWMHQKHPKTLACNAPSIAEFGYFKDLTEILHRLLEGPDIREKIKKELEERRTEGGEQWYKSKKIPRSTEGNRIALGKRCVERYNGDPMYNFLHNRVAALFAETLKIDMENMNSGKLQNISFAAKWCPSLYSEYDRSTLLCEGIARRIFPRDLPEYQGMEEAYYTYHIRQRLRKEVLVPLRKALKIAEIYMCARKWDELHYGRVPSIAMRNYKELFLKHDFDRFVEYIEGVKSGKNKIAAGALLPHEIIKSLSDGEAGQVAELQWQRIVDDLSALGKLNNCLAICDVSGSMDGTPMDVSVALGMLVSELSEEPWKGKLITFSRNPQLQLIEGTSLQAKVDSIMRLQWDLNTDFQKVFDKILEVAKAGKLSEDQMIKRLFVFSDMEFDQASLHPWETDYDAICRKFKQYGYKTVPEIVFWNLRDSKATPVPSHQKGVALVSGFSKNILTVFLENGGALSPEDTMERAIAGTEYSKLVVVD